jgi:serine/threonine-protein kinase
MAIDEKQRVTRVCPECGEEYDSPELEHCPEDGARLRELDLSDESEDPLIGEVLDDRFRIESRMAEGGMGRIYVGEQLSVERTVAVKTLRPEMSSDETVTKRFLREARVISKFSHPNVVNLIDFGQDGTHDLLYLVMELLDGMPVDELTERGRLAPPLAMRIASQTCAGLAEAHTEDVIHRDLKPENLMLVPLSDGRVETKLLDFGVARAVQDQTQLTKSGSVLGTPYYMSPEQARDGDVGPYTDVYAVGIILFEMLTGQKPVDGDSSMSIMLKHVEGQVPRLSSQLGVDPIPGGLARLVDSMIQPDPTARPQTPLEVRDELQTLRRKHGDDSIRIEPGADFDEMFQPWVREPLSVPTETSGFVDTNTGAKGAALHQTDEHVEQTDGESAIEGREEGEPDPFERTAASRAGSEVEPDEESAPENDQKATRETPPRASVPPNERGDTHAASDADEATGTSQGESIDTEVVRAEAYGTTSEKRYLWWGGAAILLLGLGIGAAYVVTGGGAGAADDDPTATPGSGTEQGSSVAGTPAASSDVGAGVASSGTQTDASTDGTSTVAAKRADTGTSSAERAASEPRSRDETDSSETGGGGRPSSEEPGRGAPSTEPAGERAAESPPDPSDTPERLGEATDREQPEASPPEPTTDESGASGSSDEGSGAQKRAEQGSGSESPSDELDEPTESSPASTSDESSSKPAKDESDSEQPKESKESSDDEPVDPGFFPAE